MVEACRQRSLHSLVQFYVRLSVLWTFVQSGEEIDFIESSVSVFEGGFATLSCKHDDPEKPNKEFYWITPTGEKITSVDNSDRYRVTGSLLHIDPTDSSAQGTYHCIMVRSNDSVDTSDATLSVYTCQDPNPCQNGGTCIEGKEDDIKELSEEDDFWQLFPLNYNNDRHTKFQCVCPFTYSGSFCERHLLESPAKYYVVSFWTVLSTIVCGGITCFSYFTKRSDENEKLLKQLMGITSEDLTSYNKKKERTFEEEVADELQEEEIEDEMLAEEYQDEISDEDFEEEKEEYGEPSRYENLEHTITDGGVRDDVVYEHAADMWNAYDQDRGKDVGGGGELVCENDLDEEMATYPRRIENRIGLIGPQESTPHYGLHANDRVLYVGPDLYGQVLPAKPHFREDPVYENDRDRGMENDLSHVDMKSGIITPRESTSHYCLGDYDRLLHVEPNPCGLIPHVGPNIYGRVFSTKPHIREELVYGKDRGQEMATDPRHVGSRTGLMTPQDSTPRYGMGAYDRVLYVGPGLYGRIQSSPPHEYDRMPPGGPDLYGRVLSEELDPDGRMPPGGPVATGKVVLHPGYGKPYYHYDADCGTHLQPYIEESQ